MSDSEDSTVTYTSISSDDGSLEVGSPSVVVYEYDGLPMHPPSPDYVPGPEHPPSPDFVPKHVYLEFMPLKDDVLPAEEQPLPVVVSPTADPPCYITESNPEEDSEEDAEDHEEDPADYPTNRDEDKEEEESSGDDDDEEEEDEYEDEKEEDHLVRTDSVPPPAYCTIARMSIRAQTPIPFLSEAEVDRFLAISTPPPSPLTSYSSPLPQIPSPPLPVSSPLPISPSPLPASPTHSLGYRAAMIRLRAESPSTSHPLPLPLPIVLPHIRASMAMLRVAAPSTYILASWSETPPSGTPPLLPIQLPTSSPPLLLPSTDCRVDVPEVTLSLWKRADYGFVGTLDAKIRRDPDREIGYGITDIWEDLDEIVEEIPETDVAELGQRMTNFVMTVRQDADEIYGRLDDAQDDRSLMSRQLNLLCRDRHAHARIARLMKSEARPSRAAWVQSMDASDTTRFEGRALRTTTQMAALQSQQTPARDPAHPDVPEKAGSGSYICLCLSYVTRSGNGEDNHDSGMGRRRQAPLSREMETMFRISNYTVENQIKFATCTLLGSALTWWNSHVRTVGHDVAYAMTWTNLKRMMTDKYYPRGEIKKLEVEMMFPEESDKIERYVGGLPDMIHGSVMASKPKTMQDAIEFVAELMDKKICTFAECQSENKRKQDDNQQQQNKRQNTSRAYAAGSGGKKPYGGSKPLCSK
ncbi:hypothetical protein Tco_1289404 [Tanacetum coccineum]